MKSRSVSVVAVLSVLVLFSLFGVAQEEKKIATAPSFDGTTGLFKTWDAENLRQGESNYTFGYDQYHRDPSKLTIGRTPVGVAIGIFDRFEFFESLDVQRHVRARDIATYRRSAGAPGALPLPAMTPALITYFSQDAPFIDVPVANGRGDSRMGVKFNILSERRGNALSLGIAGFATLPGQRGSIALSRGLSTGAYQGGFALLFSKTAARFARFHVNLGMNTTTNPKIGDVELANLANEFIYRAGMELPIQKSVRLITEMNGVAYYGSSSPPGLNYKSPVDLIFGLRVFPRDWVSIGAGYQLTLNHVEENATTWVYPSGYNGFVVQGAFASRRNDPPTVSCSVDKASILQADKTKVHAKASDPDGDNLTYSWEATGGKLSGTGDAATFDATGAAPGKYTVTATVKDKKHSASCSSDITVLKRNHAPTASIEPSTFDIIQGESQNLRCIATDPEKDPLTYTWTVEGQKLSATIPDITFGSEGRNPGSYNITCAVSDGEFSASASAKGTIRAKFIPPPVNRPPTIECQTNTVDLWSGESKELRAKASDPDGDNLTYAWSGTGVKGSGASAKFDAAGVKAGSYTVTVTVDDGRGGKASCGMTVNVSERISVTKDKCGYFKPGAYRVDNCAKAILDDLSVRMQNDSKLRANIIGYTDKTERAKKLGERRAKAVADYLEKKGVEASRMTVTDGGANNPVGDNKKASERMLNRRVEIELTVK
jgi:outer membrane protein OmpA-like peptidoglycan-associated protein